jgi:hypothetical protein
MEVIDETPRKNVSWTLEMEEELLELRLVVYKENFNDELQIINLYEKIKQRQLKWTTDYFPSFTYPPVTWYQQKGLFPSSLPINFHQWDFFEMPLIFLMKTHLSLYLLSKYFMMWKKSFLFLLLISKTLKML